MIDVKETIYETLKSALYKLRFLADNNTKLFKKIISLIILDDVFEWSTYLSDSQDIQEKLKNLRVQYILKNCEFLKEYDNDILSYVNPNVPQTNYTYKRIWDSPEAIIITSKILPSDISKLDCNPTAVFYENIEDPDRGLYKEGEPNNIDVSQFNVCDKMNLYINKATNEAYKYTEDGWELVNKPDYSKLKVVPKALEESGDSLINFSLKETGDTTLDVADPTEEEMQYIL